MICSREPFLADPMNVAKVLDLLLPPIVTKWSKAWEHDAKSQRAFGDFYGQFVKAGDLCFDVGANLGSRVQAFRRLGCRVVALEPQSQCMEKMERSFTRDAGVSLVKKAVGKEIGHATLCVSSVHVLSTMSERFMMRTTESGRFDGVTWESREEVEVTTLDALIEKFGVPRFIKIDVEGHEPEVLAGLSFAVPALSIEWTPELYEHTEYCVRRLSDLGSYEFNLSWGESMRFSRQEWRDADSLLMVLREFEGESVQFGDVYARLK